VGVQADNRNDRYNYFYKPKELLGIRTVSLGSLEFKGFSVGKVWNDSAIRNGIPPSRHSM